MGQFAEDEIILPPTGPYPGRFRLDRQPWCRAWFNEVDSHQWRQHFALGPTQSGKTLIAWVIPIMYHLFEVKESVIVGLPNMDMATDKWNDDLLPIIRASKYRNLVPASGPGSRGGTKLMSITFGHGKTLRFMSASAGDKGKAGKTSRVVAITELGAFGDVSESSEESNPFNQLLVRCEAFDDRACIYAECTVTTKSNIVWSKYLGGSESRIAVRCPHCLEFVTPERSNIIGCQDANNEIDAGEAARFYCTRDGCGGFWTDEQRIEMNRQHVLLHRGQSIDRNGVITGDPPKTRSLGFRWNAFNNLFKKTATLGEKEWKVLDSGLDTEEVAHRQFIWAMPTEETEFATIPLDRRSVEAKVAATLPRGVAPGDTEFLVCGCDVGAHLLYWTVAAARKLGEDAWATHVVNYGMVEVPSREIGIEKGLEVAFAELRDFMEIGFMVERTGESWAPWQVFIDSQYRGDDVFRACARFGNRYRGTQGRGLSQMVADDYHAPTATTKHIQEIGERWHIVQLPERRVEIVAFDSNHFKGLVHDGLRIPHEKSGSLSIFAATWQEHLKFAHHLIAEKQVERFDQRRGMIKVWERVGEKANHWLDSTALTMLAQKFCIQQLSKQVQTASVTRPLLTQKPGFDLRRI